MSDYKTLIVEEDGPACVITLNRPQRRNAISIELMDQLVAAMHAIDSNGEVRGVIITGGKEYFAAGADLNEALQIKTAEQGIDYFRRWHRVCDALEMSKKPVIAAIEGFCMTGGLELALACDLRVGAPQLELCDHQFADRHGRGRGQAALAPHRRRSLRAGDSVRRRPDQRRGGLSNGPHQPADREGPRPR